MIRVDIVVRDNTLTPYVDN